MGQNDFDNLDSSQPDDEYPADDASTATSGAFPKLTPRTFPDDDEDDIAVAEPEEVPVMEQLSGSYPPAGYGPPPSYELLADPGESAGLGAPGIYGSARARGEAPPLPPRGAVQPDTVHRRPGYGIDALIPGPTPPGGRPAAPPLDSASSPDFPLPAAGQPDPALPGGWTPDSAPLGTIPPQPPLPRTAQPPPLRPPSGQSQPGRGPADRPPAFRPPAAPPRQAPPLAAPPLTAQAPGRPSFPAADTDLGLDSGPVVAESSDVLTAEWLLHGRRAQPGPGWRRTVYRATGGLIKVGESAADLRRRDLVNRVRTPVAGGHHRVAVMSLKGGVGKTTTAVGLGATLASLRGDRVVALDANPDRGTLSDKVRLETSATVRDLLNQRSLIRRYADVRQFTSQASSRLEILASDRDPGVSIEFTADDYREVSRVIEHYYSIAITDCGTGLLHSAMSGILELADHIVLVSSPSVDGARSASATLDWLEAHQYSDLVRSAVVVISTIRPRSKSTVDLDRLEAHFASRCRDVVRIPYDAHLEEGAEVELDLLSTTTRDAYLTLAATVADGFAVPRRAHVRSATSLP
jgi:MinD-like ATPase involved in chromosome partitioning or flagellar assembly